MPASFVGVASYSMGLSERDANSQVFGADLTYTIDLGTNAAALTGATSGLIAFYDALQTKFATTYPGNADNISKLKIKCTVDGETMTKTVIEWKTFFETYVEQEPEAKTLPFKAGVNVSGMDTYMSDNQWGILEKGISIATKEFTYTNIKSQGFDYIRLPVNFYSVYYEAPTGKYDYTTDQMMGYVDTAIDLAIKNGLYVMLDFHGWFTIGAEQNDYDEFLYCWTQLANRYKDYSDMLVFELLNEPWYDNGKAQPYLSDSRLYQMQAEAIEIIRATGSNNADRLIVCCTADGNKAWKLSAMQVPDDDNIAVAIHEYDPDAFTGQGFTWAGKVHGDQVRLNPETDLSGVNYDFSQIRKFMEANPNVPIILNEFGLNLDLAADEDISYYVRYLTQFCADNNIPWAYWHYDGNDYSKESSYSWRNRDGEFALYRQFNTKGVFEWDTLALDALFLR